MDGLNVTIHVKMVTDNMAAAQSLTVVSSLRAMTTMSTCL